MKIGLFGTGAYGMALSSVLTHNKCEVTMWTKFEEEKNNLQLTRKNEALIPNFTISENIEITTSVETCVKDKDLLIIAIPAPFIDSLCVEMKSFINDNHIVIASKGIEQSSGLFINEIVEKHLNTKNIGVISGPSFAIDLVSKKPIGLSLASQSKETIELTKKAFQNNYIKIQEIKDVIGVEICGAIKNVMALAAGILDGLNMTDSTKAMLMTESIQCIKNILNIFNCDVMTAISYAGIGDLILTCDSTKSRNHNYGKLIGQKTDKKIIDKYTQENTVEGYYTLKSIYELLKKKNEQVPMINVIYKIVFNSEEPEELLELLMS